MTCSYLLGKEFRNYASGFSLYTEEVVTTGQNAEETEPH